MRNKVKRYVIANCQISEHEHGDLVKFEDMSSMLQEILKVMEVATRNRKKYKLWEEKIIKIIEQNGKDVLI